MEILFPNFTPSFYYLLSSNESLKSFQNHPIRSKQRKYNKETRFDLVSFLLSFFLSLSLFTQRYTIVCQVSHEERGGKERCVCVWKRQLRFFFYYLDRKRSRRRARQKIPRGSNRGFFSLTLKACRRLERSKSRSRRDSKPIFRACITVERKRQGRGRGGGDKYFGQLFYVSKIRTNTRYLLLIIRNELNEFFFFLNFFILFFLPSVSVFIFRINSFFLTR